MGDPSSSSLSSVDRSQRSVFVGNISYEATEQAIKEVFNQVGPVVHFRLVFDRDTGKPKGYGFCEFVDQQTAESAMRNLNGFEFLGRPLRVDSASGSERNKEEIRQLQVTLGGPPQEENPYGPPTEPAKAPESISRAVASLPPEQMFELMTQMKRCIQTNPHEARNMLLQNPQLAYALLQAQVVMRIVDPQVALTMLHRDAGPPPPPVGVAPQPRLVGPPVPLPPPPHMAPPAQPQLMPPPPSYAMQPQFAPPPPVPVQRPPPASAEEQEKAALIMQVMQLTDEQINMLPADQRQSVVQLRQQLKGQQR